MWIAEYDTQGMEFPTCVHVTKTTGTMTHGATYVPIEDGKAAREENKRLRELVRALDWCTENADVRDKCDRCPFEQSDACEPECEVMMRELRVEVDANYLKPYQTLENAKREWNRRAEQ